MLTNLPIWRKLQAHHTAMAQTRLADLFMQDSKRAEKFSIEAAQLYLDFSKNFINDETLDLLTSLAHTRDLNQQVHDLFSGQIVNNTEQRAALHTALRAPFNSSNEINREIKAAFEKMTRIVNLIRSGQWLGFNGQPITDIVNIGIGGSHLGPALTTTALSHLSHPQLNFHFMANVDGSEIQEILKPLSPATTLFIVASKTFTTVETLLNADTAKQWLLSSAPSSNAVAQHFIAITAATDRAEAYGIPETNILAIWDWVGGRYSLWSTMGLITAIAIGIEKFQELLAGAHAMDEHFRNAPFTQNMPVILGLLSIWYNNFFNAHTQAILPYDHRLRFLPLHLQQLEMESNGKRVQKNCEPVEIFTSPIIWGGVGTNGQHAFHQLILQGTHLIPCDFIAAINPDHSYSQHHQSLLANCLAQSQTLMQEQSAEEIKAQLLQQGVSAEHAQVLSQHRAIPGNQPSNTILLHRLTPFTLGALVALYEHKVFVQSAIWNINCFDQWGVELGKRNATRIQEDLINTDIKHAHDNSTSNLLNYIKQKMS